jgi:NADPH:quinone reductase-like Zn-dependent oxidoreductase
MRANLHACPDMTCRDGSLVPGAMTGYPESRTYAQLAPTPIDLDVLERRRASVTATMLRGRSYEQKAGIVVGVRRDVLPLIEAGLIRSVIDTLCAMKGTAQPHTLLDSGSTIGKVVIYNQ